MLAPVNTLRRQSQLVLLVAGLVLLARLFGVHGHFCTLDDAGCAIGGHAAFATAHLHGGLAGEPIADAGGPDCAGDCDAEVSLELLTLSKLLDDLPEAGALLACLLLLALLWPPQRRYSPATLPLFATARHGRRPPVRAPPLPL